MAALSIPGTLNGEAAALCGNEQRNAQTNGRQTCSRAQVDALHVPRRSQICPACHPLRHSPP